MENGAILHASNKCQLEDKYHLVWKYWTEKVKLFWNIFMLFFIKHQNIPQKFNLLFSIFSDTRISIFGLVFILHFYNYQDQKIFTYLYHDSYKQIYSRDKLKKETLFFYYIFNEFCRCIAKIPCCAFFNINC